MKYFFSSRYEIDFALASLPIQNERLVVRAPHRDEAGPLLGDQVLSFCERREANISFRSVQLETIQSLVRSGLGLSLIPAMAAQRERHDLPECRSMSSPRLSRQVVAVWPRQRPPERAGTEFLKMPSKRNSIAHKR